MPATESLDALAIPQSFGTSLTEDTSDLRSDFGDGASQRAAFGINTARQRWSIAYKNLPNAMAVPLLAFLRARGKVEAFLWTPPDRTNTQRQFTRDSALKVDPDQGGLQVSISFTVVEEFDL